MRPWDLTSGASKLVLGLQSLQAADTEARQYWNDEAHRKFQETYLEPLEPKVRALLDALHRLAEMLAAAERECGTTTRD
jgi:uncharacterized protein YukE